MMLVAMDRNDPRPHIARWLFISLGEVVAMLAALLGMTALLVITIGVLIAGAYAKGLGLLAVFAAACALLVWIGKRLHHWVKMPPPPVHGWLSAKYAPLAFAVACLAMGTWPLYLVAHGLADGEMWTLNSRAHNSIVSAAGNPALYWLTVAKGGYLALTMLYGAFWFVHHRRRVLRAALAAGAVGWCRGGTPCEGEGSGS